jgi:hypothetical protein
MVLECWEIIHGMRESSITKTEAARSELSGFRHERPAIAPKRLSLLKTPDVKSSAIGMPSSSDALQRRTPRPSVTQGDVMIAEALVAQAEAT